MTALRRYGWVRDQLDHRDHLYAAPAAVLEALPPSMDLRGSCPEVYDQGQLGSCTGQAIAAAFEFDLIRQAAPDFLPSRLFIYYNERKIEHTIPVDAGARIRDGIKTVVKQGVCPEGLWPYDVARFADEPTSGCYTEALKHRVTAYARVPQTLAQLRGALAHGRPFVAGISVFEALESAEVARTGVVPMPGGRERPLGGHAVLAVGYNDATSRFLVRNSWGATWGNGGHFSLPYAYLTEPDLAADFWTLTAVSG